jgi:propionyl-CoA carboxylase beta chain
MTMTPRDRLTELERQAELGGGEERLRRQRESGKLTTRERVDLLFDAGTFEEVDKLVTHRCRDFGMGDDVVPGDGVLAGHGRVYGRPSTRSRRTSRSPAGRCRRRTPRRSSR